MSTDGTLGDLSRIRRSDDCNLPRLIAADIDIAEHAPLLILKGSFRTNLSSHHLAVLWFVRKNWQTHFSLVCEEKLADTLQFGFALDVICDVVLG